jgi:hypothetical protein
VRERRVNVPTDAIETQGQASAGAAGRGPINEIYTSLLDDADTRLHVVRLMRKRVAQLMESAGGDESVQRAMLVNHATSMQIRLESMETGHWRAK